MYPNWGNPTQRDEGWKRDEEGPHGSTTKQACGRGGGLAEARRKTATMDIAEQQTGSRAQHQATGNQVCRDTLLEQSDSRVPGPACRSSRGEGTGKEARGRAGDLGAQGGLVAEEARRQLDGRTADGHGVRETSKPRL